MAANGSSNTTEVPKEEWKFGYDSKGMTKTRILVTLKENKNAIEEIQVGTFAHVWGNRNCICVHQYDKETETSKYYCVGCYDKKQIKNYAQLIDNHFYAPTLHNCAKADAKFIDRDQANLEVKHMIYLKIFAAFSSSPYSFAKPRHQEFSLPTPILRYLILNPQTSAMYDKLVKSCKWFYGRNKLTLIGTTLVVKARDYGKVFRSTSVNWKIENLPLSYKQ